MTDNIGTKYISELYAAGKVPATVAIVVAAVKRYAANAGVKGVVGELTNQTLIGIRRAGGERGRGQVDSLTSAGVERVCARACRRRENHNRTQGFCLDSAGEQLPVANF